MYDSGHVTLNYPLMGVVMVTWPVFNFGPHDIFGIGDTRHIKFRVLTDRKKYKGMHDRLPPKGMRSRSRDLFKL